MTRIWAFAFLFSVLSVSLVAQPFQKIDISDSMHSGKVEWVDLDGDSDLDIFHLFWEEGVNNFSRVYENTGNGFVSRVTGLPGVQNADFAMADYDNDGDIDILIGGMFEWGNNISRLYKNTGNFSFVLAQSFPGYFTPTFSWVDIDNDKDLDFMLNGTDNSSPATLEDMTIVFENVGGVFNELTKTNLPKCSQCSVDWADANGDGKMDVLMTGITQSSAIARIYLNNGDKTFSKDKTADFKLYYKGSAHWGDFDADGDKDVMISGYQFGENHTSHCIVYENDKNNWRERADININPTDQWDLAMTEWIDYNHDGKLDIAVIANTEVKLYRNIGKGNFTEEPNTGLPKGIYEASFNFGDYDNDRDIDLCYLGFSPPAVGVYKNMSLNRPADLDAKPSPPSGGR